MWVYGAIGVALVYAIYKEHQSLGCEELFRGKDCFLDENRNGKAVIGTVPQETDGNEEILDKIDLAADYDNRFVKWRAFFIISFVATMLLFFVTFKRVPTEWELMLGIIVVFLCFLSYSSFYQFHLKNLISENIHEGTGILRKRV